MIVLIDNYDSFTFNLVHYLGGLGADVVVHRNDKIAVEDVLAAEAGRDRAVARPLHAERGRHLPRPDRAGRAHDPDPRRLPRPSGDRPGVRRRGGARALAGARQAVARSSHQGAGVFRGINGPFKATRYHSLVVERDTMPDDAGRHRGNRRRAGHGARAQDAAGARRAVPSRKHRVRARPSDPEEFPRPRRAVECAAGARRIEERRVTEDFKALIAKVASGATLTREEAAHAFDRMMSGEATPSQMGGLLMALRVRGETVDEITGAVTAMRAKMLKVDAPPDAIDVVGTGGDASGSFNISTCAAFIVAGAGVPVAKHGNRALSSRSGAADVLGALGVKIELSARAGRRVHRRGRHRLHVRAGASSGDEERRPDARRARHPHDLQSARPALQSGRRQAPDDRRVLAAMGRADGAGAEEPRLRVRLGGARLRRARRDHHLGPDRDRRAGERQGPRVRDQAGGRRPQDAPSPRRCAAATPRPTPRR